MLQTLAEGFSVLAGTLWPASLTIEFLVGPRLPWGPETLLWSVAALTFLSLLRRDLTRLAYLVVPFALLSYTGWVGLFATVALIRGSEHGAFIPVAVVFGSLFMLVARWIERHRDDLGGTSEARRLTRRCS
jgi:hypothetical protein